MKKALLLIFFLSASATTLFGQTYDIIASGLHNPIGITKDNAGNIYVAETGTGNDDGRILLITPSNLISTLVTGLPSNHDMGSISGPYRIYLFSHGIMKVVIGEGFDPIEGSVLTFDISKFKAGDAALTLADTLSMLSVRPWVISQNIGSSNPYSVAWDTTGNTYVVDASANLVVKIDTAFNYKIITTFPKIALNVSNFSQYTDYVPTIILNSPDGGFYIGNLTGWPFLDGLASIIKMDENGVQTPFVSNLTQVTEMEIDSLTGDLYALQYAHFDTSALNWISGTASIIRISQGGSQIDTIVSGFGPSAGMVRDSIGGFYVTCQKAGTVIHISFPITHLTENNNETLKVVAYPNPFTQNASIDFSLTEALPVRYYISDYTGKIIYESPQELMFRGAHSIKLDAKKLNHQGLYTLLLLCGDKQARLKLLAFN